jgi:hypothetical protein
MGLLQAYILPPAKGVPNGPVGGSELEASGFMVSPAVEEAVGTGGAAMSRDTEGLYPFGGGGGSYIEPQDGASLQSARKEYARPPYWRSPDSVA